jgi:hypothetical protein
MRAATVSVLVALGWGAALMQPVRPALAWDDFGHMQVALVAYRHLSPAVRERTRALLKLNPRYPNWILGARPGQRDQVAFMRAATWADAIKGDPDYTSANDEPNLPTAVANLGYADKLRHMYWHYVDQPLAADGTPTLPATVPNASTQIAAFRASLSELSTDEAVKSYDLVWLLHLVGDIHQPLHCVARYDRNDPGGDRGGHNVKISGNHHPEVCDDPRFCPYNPTDDLHAFWDSITGSSYDTDKVSAAALALTEPDRRAARILDPAIWLTEGAELARQAVYVSPIGVGDGPFAVDAAYQRSALALARRRIALAGQRLAAVLEECFAQERAAHAAQTAKATRAAQATKAAQAAQESKATKETKTTQTTDGVP